MGIFRMACQNMRLFMKRRTFLFVLLLIGFAFANFYSMHLMTATIGDLRAFGETLDSEQIVRIDCALDAPRVDQKLILNQISESGCTFQSAFFYSLSDDFISGESVHPAENRFLALVDFIDESIADNQNILKSGRYFNEQDLQNAADLCCLTSSMCDFSAVLNPVGTQVSLNGKPATVIGVVSDSAFDLLNFYDSAAFVVAPASAVDARDLPLNSIELRTASVISDSAEAEIAAIVRRFAPNAEFEWPAELSETREWNRRVGNVFLNAAIIMLALTNVLAVLMAWIQMNRVNLYATYVAGASKGALYLFVAFNALVADAMSIPIAYALYLATAKLREWGQKPYAPNAGEQALILGSVALILVLITLIRSRSIIQNIEAQKGKV